MKDVSFSNNGDSLEAKIIASSDSKFTYFELHSPHRLVIDFHGIQNTISFKEKQIDAVGVERVRTSMFSDKNRKATRIVFDLKKDVPYRVIEDGTGIVRIVFGETARAPENQTAGPAMVPASLVQPALPSTVLAMIPEPSSPAGTPRLPGVKLQASLFKPEAIPAPQAPVVQVSSLEVPAATASLPPIPTPSALVAAADPFMQQQTQVTVAPATQPVVQQTAPGTTPQYTGEIARSILSTIHSRTSSD